MEASLSELSSDEARYFRFSFFRPSLGVPRDAGCPLDPCEENGDRESSISILTAGDDMEPLIRGYPADEGVWCGCIPCWP